MKRTITFEQKFEKGQHVYSIGYNSSFDDNPKHFVEEHIVSWAKVEINGDTPIIYYALDEESPRSFICESCLYATKEEVYEKFRSSILKEYAPEILEYLFGLNQLRN